MINFLETKCGNYINPDEIATIDKKKRRYHFVALLSDLRYLGTIKEDFFEAVDFINADYYSGYDIVITTKQGKSYIIDNYFSERCEMGAKEILLDMQEFYNRNHLATIELDKTIIDNYTNNPSDTSKIVRAYAANKKHLSFQSYVSSTIKLDTKDRETTIALIKDNKNYIEALLRSGK